ncbi:MAG: hypothetical protein HY360_10765, partial [Verrucomicrobia bacterium]|nr:hypothetical protein [Verrucomicrobiota bacterium]
MDNEIVLKEKDGKVTFPINTSPCYVRGMKDGAKMTLGDSDHSDSGPAKESVRLANPAGDSWHVSTERDEDYENSHPEFIKRFPGKMSIQGVNASAEQGGKALAVHLEPQEKERKTMPFYTTLVPPKPITIPGKASHLGLWVRAASDWGRVVYCLRDAKGERWLSVGKKNEWNCDDPNCWSQFNFDGWRYLRFELPANAPYDGYREAGTTWWGYYGQGDGVVDLPLTLEKVLVERRTHVIQLDQLKPANPEDVLLANLRAEYEKPADQSDEAIRLARLRMPHPAATPELENPIQKLLETGGGAPTTITKVAPPEREYDGTRCLVFFEAVSGAKSYDVWVSPYPDGRGAICLAQGWTEPGKLLTGLNANTALYLFVTYTDQNGKISRPSAAKHILLKDDFPFK